MVREKLRRHALQFAAAINANPAAWRAEAAWLKHLPSCQTVRFTNDPNHPALTDGRFIEENPDAPDGHREFLYDDEAETVRRSGPICRKLSEGWQAAIHRFRERFTDRYYDFGVRDAKRIALLTALILNRDFDGDAVGLRWPWEQPPETEPPFNCRAWAWLLSTSGLFEEKALLAYVEVAAEYLSIHGVNASAHEPIAQAGSEKGTGDPRYPDSEWIRLQAAAKDAGIPSGTLHRWVADLPERDKGETEPRRKVVVRRSTLARLIQEKRPPKDASPGR